MTLSAVLSTTALVLTVPALASTLCWSLVGTDRARGWCLATTLSLLLWAMVLALLAVAAQ